MPRDKKKYRIYFLLFTLVVTPILVYWMVPGAASQSDDMAAGIGLLFISLPIALTVFSTIVFAFLSISILMDIFWKQSRLGGVGKYIGYYLVSILLLGVLSAVAFGVASSAVVTMPAWVQAEKAKITTAIQERQTILTDSTVLRQNQSIDDIHFEISPTLPKGFRTFREHLVFQFGGDVTEDVSWPVSGTIDLGGGGLACTDEEAPSAVHFSANVYKNKPFVLTSVRFSFPHDSTGVEGGSTLDDDYWRTSTQVYADYNLKADTLGDKQIDRFSSSLVDEETGKIIFGNLACRHKHCECLVN